MGASNGLPQDESLAAFADRFLIRLFVDPIPDPRLEEPLEGGWRLAQGETGGAVTLGRTTRAVLRLLPWSLTVADELGRVLVADLERGLVRRNLRL